MSQKVRFAMEWLANLMEQMDSHLEEEIKDFDHVRWF
jgi:hypothetical protein